MKKHILLLGVCLVVGLLAGCGEKSAKPLKEGTVWSVVWSESPNSKMELFRAKPAPPNSFGEYGVDMYGKLYPGFLEIQRAGSAHTQIIPMQEIIALDFGE